MTTSPPADRADDVVVPGWRGHLLRVVIALVVVAGIALVAGSLVHGQYRARDAWSVLVLAGIALTYDVVARRVERLRRMTSAGPYVNMNSVWVFGCSVGLPLQWCMLLTLAIYAYLEGQSVRDGTRRPWYRVAFNTAVALISFALVDMVSGSSAGLGTATHSLSGVRVLTVVAAVLAALVCNTLLIGVAIVLTTRGVGLRSIIGSGTDNLLEVATLALGAFVGLVIQLDIWFCLLAVPAMVLLQRSALVEQLESAASEDGKTGLLNAAAWEHLAGREMARIASRGLPASVMVIDLDHFKRVNDTYGHLTGDAVLRAVATCMGGMLRDRDLLSRFGGEEFVALLPNADAFEAHRVAERLRARIAEVVVTQVGDPPQPVLTAQDPLDGASVQAPNDRIRVTVSVGLATYPDHGDTLTGLMTKADAALYDAKRSGRNQVRVSV